MAVGVKTPHSSSELASFWEHFYTRRLSYFFSLSANSKEWLFSATVLLQQPGDKFNSDVNNPNRNNSTTSFGEEIFTRHYQKYTPKFLTGKLAFSCVL